MLKQKILIVSLLLVIPVLAFAKPITIETAQQVAYNLYSERNYNASNNFSIEKSFIEKENDLNIYYIFNFCSPSNGFVMVSADDIVYPILGYSFDHNYGLENHPPQFDAILTSFKEQIIYAVSNGLSATKEITNEWKRLSVRPEYFEIMRDIRDVNPLLTANWNQDWSWNAECPVDPAGPGGHAYAGCVAVSMGQVMKYWSHPIQGIGSHGYYHSTYGYLFADFGATTYEWSNMPNYSATNATKIALFHLGVSVDMNYGPNGSGAYLSGYPGALYALETYFDYNPCAYFAQRNSYPTTTWENMIRGELDNGRPLIYRGEGANVGHAFNLDGYQGTNYFHFNWGFSGWFNGYYYLNNLNPGGMNLTINQGAIFNLSPNIQLPAVDITYPGQGQTFTSPDITTTGTANSPNGYIIEVHLKLNNGSWQTANGTTSWSYDVTLQQGPNTIYAKSKDNNNNWSEIDEVTVNYISNGSIQGDITLYGGSNCYIEDVVVEAGGYSTNPNIMGHYIIEDIPQSIYDVTASLDQWATQTIDNVQVIAGQIISNIDFTLSQDPPNWILITGTQYSMVVMASIDLFGEEFSGASGITGYNMVGAFGPDGESDCRSIANWVPGPNIWYFTVVSNDGSVTEIISFKIYACEADLIYDCNETVIFVDNETIGTPSDPFELTVSERTIQEFILGENWNWISFNVHPDNTSISSIFEPLTAFPDIYQVKSQSQSATYSPDWMMWFGDLTTISDGEAYLLDMLNAVSLFEVCGTPIDPSTQIELSIDWNWIGYYPDYILPIDEAMASVVPNAYQIKNQTQSSTYNPDWGWLGDLTQMEPNVGYKVFMTAPDILIYPEPTDFVLKNTNLLDGGSDWEVISGTQYNMVLMSHVKLNN